MDLLRSQFTRHDAGRSGRVSVNDFRASLERFGVRGGLDPVVQKFSTAGDGNGGGNTVNYEAFLKHFAGRQGGALASAPAPAPAAAAQPQQQQHQQQVRQQPPPPQQPRTPPTRFEAPPPPRHYDPAPAREAPPPFVADVAPPPQPPPPQQQQPPQHGSEPPQQPKARVGMYDGVSVRRGAAGALDVHRSDSGTVAALALGEIAGDKVDPLGTSHTGRRMRVAQATRADEATLPVSSVAVLSGEVPLPQAAAAAAAAARGRSRTPRRGRGGSSAAHSPARGYDVISGRETTGGGSPTRHNTPRHEGKRHVNEPQATTPRHSVGLRTFGDTDRPFAEERRGDAVGRGLQTDGQGTASHFALGHNECPAAGKMQWPEGPRTPRLSASHVSNIPGWSADTGEKAEQEMQRKARTRTPSSFGPQPIDPKECLSPRPVRPARGMTPKALRAVLGTKVSTNEANVTKAWVNLSKEVGSDGNGGKGMSNEQFADVIRAKYCVDVTSDDVRHATGGKESVTFKDFTGFCKAPSGSGDLLKKEPTFVQRPVGRRCGHGGSAQPTPPFATVTDEPSASTARGRSRGPSGRITDHRRSMSTSSLNVGPDHYHTTNMRTFSPMRMRSPRGGVGGGGSSGVVGERASFDTAAGLPNRRREASQQRKRTFSPVMNRETAGNLIFNSFHG